MYTCEPTHVHKFQVGGKPQMLSKGSREIAERKGNQWQKSPLMCQGIQISSGRWLWPCRSLEIIRIPCCCSSFFVLTMQIPLPGIESKAKVL